MTISTPPADDLLTAAWLLPAVLPLLVAAALPVRRPALRAAAAAGWASVAGAAVALAGLGATGRLQPLQASLLGFATVLAAVAVGYSRRHLDGDPAAGTYRRRLLLASAAAVVTVVAHDLLLLAVAWVVAGRALLGLVGHHADLEASVRAVAALRRSLRVGDVAFVAALAVLAAGAASTSVGDAARWAQDAPAPLLAVVGLGLLVGAATRSAQWPFSRWLPLSVVAPAPVSALLHAGIANAPVVVLLTLAPVWEASGWFAAALLAVGLGTALLTFPRLLVRADLKTRLAWSTTAQLGFMLALLAVGAHAAAVIHLVLHGLYKANAFLRAGDDISRARRDRPTLTPLRTRLAGAALGLGAAVAVLALDRGWEQPLTAAAVVVAATAGGYGLWSRTARAGVRAAAAGIALVALAVVLGGARLVADAWGLPFEADGALAWASAAVVLVFAAASAVVRRRRPVGLWVVLHRAADPSLGLLAARRAARAARAGTGASGRTAVRADARTSGARPGGPAEADVRDLVDAAARSLPPTWGWQGFVAANPLWGNRSVPFAEALAGAWADPATARRGGAPDAPQDTERALDDAVAGWLAAWTAPAGPPWAAPHRGLGLWDWFRTVAVRDPLLARAARSAGDDVLPEHAWELVARAVGAARAAGATEPRALLRHELGRLVGWSAYLARRRTTAAELDVDALVDLVAVRVAVRLLLTGGLLPADAPSIDLHADGDPAVDAVAGAGDRRAEDVVRDLVATETRLREGLADRLSERLDALAAGDPTAAAEAGAGRPRADLVFCIDARSERLRRHLESLGRYRTAGFAGFFALPLARSVEGGPTTSRLPALLVPGLRTQVSAPDATVTDLLDAALREALDAPGGGFAAVELAGVRALGGIARVVRPRLARPARPVAGQVPDDDRAAALDAAVALARAAGLGPSSGRLVVLVGHGSTSTNNTAAAAYDCGACGGYRGGVNAALAATLLSAPDGRRALAAAGLALPDDTVVVAAEHDTATDDVLLPAADDVPASHRAEYRRLVEDLAVASARTALERSVRLPGAAPATEEAAVAEVRRRAADPAQVRHEWGLAGNAFFVAAPRDLTRGLDLDGTAFLHDYDAAADPEGRLLETILTAPAVVAHWINAQYLLSGLDPARWGSGSKTAHNPVGTIGVVSGAGGDLRVGLPEQAVHLDGAPRFPLARLLVVLAAAPHAVDAVLARHPDVTALVAGEWVTVWAVPPGGTDILRRDADGWHEVPGRRTGVPQQGADRTDPDRLSPVR